MGRIAQSVIGACVLSAALLAQEHPAAPHDHPEAQKLTNPVAATPESIAAGAKIYAKLCANCHGTSGRGNGRLAAGAAAYGARPSDLVDGTWQHGSSDGEIFVVIRDGIGPNFAMDGFRRMMADEDLWHVVNYIRSLAIK
jgi:mono/diheme cytochrome c family protein